MNTLGPQYDIASFFQNAAVFQGYAYVKTKNHNVDLCDVNTK